MSASQPLGSLLAGIKHIKKYRTLDDSGKSHVDTVLSWDADRMKQIGLAGTASLEDKTVEQLEAEYKKSLSHSARNTGSDASSIIGERKEA